jgi:hypothetical protein
VAEKQNDLHPYLRFFSARSKQCCRTLTNYADPIKSTDLCIPHGRLLTGPIKSVEPESSPSTGAASPISRPAGYHCNASARGVFASAIGPEHRERFNVASS